MDTQDNSRSCPLRSKQLHHVDLLGREASAAERLCYRHWLDAVGNSPTEGLTRLAEAIAKGDISVATSLLRLWGVRR